MRKPNAAELLAFYKANRMYVDLIVENALRNDPQKKELHQQMEFERQVKEFLNEFPDAGLKTPDDFLHQENAAEFLEYVKKGLSLVQAYKLCNYAMLLQHEAERAKKSKAVSMESKAHLRPTGVQAAASGGSVPEDVKELYHALLGDWSESQIAKHYHRK